MITVHHLNNSRSQRVLWLLEELEIPYEIKHYQRNRKTLLAPQELFDVHPLGKSPVITDGAQTVAESGAIITFLLNKYGKGKFLPSQHGIDELRFSYWMHYAEGSMMPPLVLTLIFSQIPKQPMPFFIRPIARGISQQVLKNYVTPQLNLHLNFVESELAKSKWFAGSEFSGADIQMSFPIEAAQARGLVNSSRPCLVNYLKVIHERPAYQRALAKGGPYDLLR